jgi:SAM-dependent methyltransferase
MKAFLRAHTPEPIWAALRSTKYLAIDSMASLRGRPPKDLIAAIGGELEVGDGLVQFFIEQSLIASGSRILEIGCGIGRVAAPLTKYLSQRGSYCGFDIVARSIKWCEKNITTRHPNFQFIHADIYNKTYNDAGKIKASEFNFPYAEASFDFVFLTSVFTHMLPADVEHYFSEITRVMKPGAHCLATWFLLNEEADRHIKKGEAFLPFSDRLGACRVANRDIPEVAIAYPESDIEAIYASHGMKKSHPTLYGSWCGRLRQDGKVQDRCIYQKA